jgi:hypothetical protein
VDALSEFGQDVANDAHANEGGDREADTRGVDLGTVGADDSFILHAANTFGDGRRGETHAPAKFCKGNAGISLEFVEELPAQGIEKLLPLGLGQRCLLLKRT